MLKIDPSARISPLADLEPSAKGTDIIIGKNSRIDSFVKIKPAGGNGRFKMGNNVYVNSGCVFYTGNGIDIGDNVLIAANCTFAPTSHAFNDKNTLIREQGFLPSRGGIIIESDVWVGANVVLLDGAILREGCVVGAGSLVNSEIDPFTVNFGNPIKIVKVRQ